MFVMMKMKMKMMMMMMMMMKMMMMMMMMRLTTRGTDGLPGDVSVWLEEDIRQPQEGSDRELEPPAACRAPPDLQCRQQACRPSWTRGGDRGSWGKRRTGPLLLWLTSSSGERDEGG